MTNIVSYFQISKCNVKKNLQKAQINVNYITFNILPTSINASIALSK